MENYISNINSMKLIFQMSIKLWKKIMKKNYLYIVDLHKLLIKLIYIG